MSDGAAATPVRISPFPLLAIVVRLATTVARHIVNFECIVTNVPAPCC